MSRTDVKETVDLMAVLMSDDLHNPVLGGHDSQGAKILTLETDVEDEIEGCNGKLFRCGVKLVGKNYVLQDLKVCVALGTTLPDAAKAVEDAWIGARIPDWDGPSESAEEFVGQPYDPELDAIVEDAAVQMAEAVDGEVILVTEEVRRAAKLIVADGLSGLVDGLAAYQVELEFFTAGEWGGLDGENFALAFNRDEAFAATSNAPMSPEIEDVRVVRITKSGPVDVISFEAARLISKGIE